MITFKQFVSESSVVGGAMQGALMSPHGPNHNPNKTKKTREVQPDRVTISQAALDHMKNKKSGPTGPENSMAGLIGGTRKAK
jgi:hypothetical protein